MGEDWETRNYRNNRRHEGGMNRKKERALLPVPQRVLNLVEPPRGKLRNGISAGKLGSDKNSSASTCEILARLNIDCREIPLHQLQLGRHHHSAPIRHAATSSAECGSSSSAGLRVPIAASISQPLFFS